MKIRIMTIFLALWSLNLNSMRKPLVKSASCSKITVLAQQAEERAKKNQKDPVKCKQVRSVLDDMMKQSFDAIAQGQKKIELFPQFSPEIQALACLTAWEKGLLGGKIWRFEDAEPKDRPSAFIDLSSLCIALVAQLPH